MSSLLAAGTQEDIYTGCPFVKFGEDSVAE
jgi:hypothetical protein